MPEEIPILRAWNLRNLKDTRSGITEAIERAETVPAAMKSALVEAVAALPAEIKLIKLDAHAQYHAGMLMLNATIAPL